MFARIIVGTFLAIRRQKHLLALNLFQTIYLRGSLVLIFILSGGILMTRITEWFLASGQYFDPFSNYASLLPGNPSHILNEYPCVKTDSRINGQLNVDEFSCSIFPKDDHFDIIHIEGRNDKISEVTFYALDLNLGQVLLHWKPISPLKLNNAIVGWNAHHFLIDSYIWNQNSYSVQVYGSDLRYQRLVRIIVVSSRES